MAQDPGLPSMLRQTEAQIRQILPWMPVDEECNAGIDDQGVKYVQSPLMRIEISCHAFGKLH
jgi:hypothetical protein